MKIKNVILILGVFTSISAMASYPSSVVTLTSPTHGDTGIRFSAEQNNYNGVCRALGYEEYVSSSVRATSSYGNAIIVDRSGKLRDAVPNHYYVKSITCSNFRGYVPQVLSLLTRPVYPGTNTPYSGESNDFGGVCRSQGHDGGFAFTSSSSYGDAFVVNHEGHVVSMESHHYYLNEIVCFTSDGYTHYTNTRNYDDNTGRARLNYSFRDRSFQIAQSVYDVTKAIEPYLNNSQEQEIDELKRQAQLLKSRVQAGRELEIVRNTLFHLGVLLESSSGLIDTHLETDALDSFAGRFMTANESITAMVNFLDHDFDGERSELY